MEKREISLKRFLLFFAIIIILILIFQILTYLLVSEINLSPSSQSKTKTGKAATSFRYPNGDTFVELIEKGRITEVEIIIKCPPADPTLCEQAYKNGIEYTFTNLKYKGAPWPPNIGTYYTTAETTKTIG